MRHLMVKNSNDPMRLPKMMIRVLLLLCFSLVSDVMLFAQADTITSQARPLAPPPPPPPPPPSDDEAPYYVVERMPRFPGCEDKGTEEEKKACAQEQLLAFVAKHLVYPDSARQAGIEGTVVVRFTVFKDGSVGDATLIRDIGYGCGTAGMQVVEEMVNQRIRFTPTGSRGRAVNVYFNLPVKFRLTDEEH
jgi:protein TonB